MKKNIYLSIITLITIICIVAGTCFHLLGFGVKMFSNFTSKNSYGKYSDTRTFDSSDIDSLSLDMDVMDVTVKTGNDFSVSYTCDNKNLVPTIEVSGRTLNIVQHGDPNWFHLFSSHSSHSEITVTVPKTCSLKMLTADSSVGDVYLENIQADECSFDLSVGDIDISNSRLGNIDISSSTGDVDLTDSVFENITVDTSVGDVDIDSANDLSSYSFDLDTSVGDISINDSNYGDHYDTDGINGKSISVDASTGDVDITY